jgi:hypothetical protein
MTRAAGILAAVATLNIVFVADISIIKRIVFTTQARIITVDVIASCGGGACTIIVFRSVLRFIKLLLQVLNQLLQCKRQSDAPNPLNIQPGMKSKSWY